MGVCGCVLILNKHGFRLEQAQLRVVTLLNLIMYNMVINSTSLLRIDPTYYRDSPSLVDRSLVSATKLSTVLFQIFAKYCIPRL